jgi:hypothetical protein
MREGAMAKIRHLALPIETSRAYGRGLLRGSTVDHRQLDRGNPEVTTIG